MVGYTTLLLEWLINKWREIRFQGSAPQKHETMCFLQRLQSYAPKTLYNLLTVRYSLAGFCVKNTAKILTCLTISFIFIVHFNSFFCKKKD